MILETATPDDLDLLLGLRRETASWLSAKGIDQWSNPFPPEHLLASIESGTVYLLRDGLDVAGTVTLDDDPEPGLWLPEELEQPSKHLHKLIVPRKYAGQGIGTRLIEWAIRETAKAGADWVRINVWTTNRGLQDFWLSQGFQHVRTVSGGGVNNAGVAGWLAQRPTR